MPTVRLWFPLAVALVLNATANVLLKVGAATAKPVAENAAALDKALAFLNGVTLVAIVFFGVNILFYRKALQGLSLSTAYPVMLSGSLLIATLAARFVPVLNEKISPLQVGGMLVIVVGVWMVTRS
jgi:multidrug transporter EmrE-like cation transporter